MVVMSVDKLYYLGYKSGEFVDSEGKCVRFFRVGFTTDDDDTLSLSSGNVSFCDGFKKFDTVRLIFELYENKKVRITNMIAWEDNDSK